MQAQVNPFVSALAVTLALVFTIPASASEQTVPRPDRDILAISLDDAGADDEPELTPEMARALKEYDRRRLVRRPLQITTTYVTNGQTTGTSVSMSWVVMDGGGTNITGIGFAEMMGDRATLRQMDREKRKGNIGFGVMMGIAVPLIIGGYALAGTAADHDSGRIAGGIIAGTTGVGLALTAWMPPAYAIGKQNWVARFYSPDEADQRIDEYNAEVREELGLSETDVLMLDMFGRRPRVEIRPVFGGNYLGIVGRF